MKKTKKVICMLLAAMTLFGGSGCSNKKKKADKETVTLKWFVPGPKQSDHELVINEINKIIEPKIGAKLDLQFIDMDTFEERMKMYIALQKEIDIMWVGYSNDYIDAVENGGIMDITQMLDQTPKLKESVPDYFWDATRYKGRIYAVPNVQIASMSYAYNIKKDLVEKYNIDVTSIKEPEDIESVLEIIKKNEPDLYPIQPKFGPGLWTQEKYQILCSPNLAVRKDDPECKVVNLLETPEYQKGIKILRRWFKKGYIREDVASLTDDSLDTNQGNYGVMINVLKPGIAEETKQKKGYEIDIAEITTPFYDGSGVLTTLNAVSSTSKHPEKALEFIELVNTDKELYNIICFGIEGTHYTKSENGKVIYKINSGWNPNGDWKFGNQFNALLVEGQPDDVWEQTEKMNTQATKSRLLGFTFITENVNREISNIMSVYDKYELGMLKGYTDPDEYLDKFKEEVKAAGIDKVQAELQKQIDEFLASQ